MLRTGQHLYAQLFSADGSTVIAAANTLQADVKEGLKNGKNSDAAAPVSYTHLDVYKRQPQW